MVISMESIGALPVKIRYHAVITSRALRFLDGVVVVVAVTMLLLNNIAEMAVVADGRRR